ncbi:hypothetical protein LOAG_13780 [Loa loa]|uniref:Uncharacterized protein n=1 Tax=Loa loa TaxID=7209 RepID=A0A1S0TJX1_LOALO|nr:hypothetical protein LOAG_13780 [Loa loa]EFO14736.1 hypothetical protein LOAG_13780 [Loa loa]
MRMNDEDIAILICKFDRLRISDKDNKEVEKIQASQMDQKDLIVSVIKNVVGEVQLAFCKLWLTSTANNGITFSEMMSEGDCRRCFEARSASSNRDVWYCWTVV